MMATRSTKKRPATRAKKTRKAPGALTGIAIAALEDMKAVNVKVLDVRKLTDVTDTMIVATGTSNRHVKSIADRVIERCRQAGHRAHGVEGERDRGQHLVAAAPECHQHCHAFRFAGRLAVDLPVQHDGRVGGKHRTIGTTALCRKSGQRLFPCQAPHVVRRTLARQRLLVELGGKRLVAHADLGQQLAAAERSGREEDGVVTH